MSVRDRRRAAEDRAAVPAVPAVPTAATGRTATLETATLEGGGR